MSFINTETGEKVAQADTKEAQDNSQALSTTTNYDPVHDKCDMRRLGRHQELKRKFRFFSIGGFPVVVVITWEFSLVTSIFSLSNGGAAGAIWLTLAVCFGMFCTNCSMAEMASMGPVPLGF